MNKHILMVMRWLNDKDSVSQEELVENKKSAYTAYAMKSYHSSSNIDAAAYSTASCASYPCVCSDDVEMSLERYFECSGESKQYYIDEINKDNELKLKQFIADKHNGNISEYCRVNGYHQTQVKRFIAKDAYYGDGQPFYTVKLNKASANGLRNE